MRQQIMCSSTLESGDCLMWFCRERWTGSEEVVSDPQEKGDDANQRDPDPDRQLPEPGA
jgi:hypothetical protein